MMRMIRGSAVSICLLIVAAPASADALANLPDAVIDLRTTEGAAQVRAEWRTQAARVVETAHHDPGPDMKPSGPANRTHTVEPQAGATDFDDAAWRVLDPAALETRVSTGRLAFQWYRLSVTIPDAVGRFDPRGATVVFELVLDDYAEVWVDGRLPQVLGQTGGTLISGWNAPNRVVLTRDAQPGQRFQLAIFASNGPLSSPPPNFIWVRSATVDFYRPGRFGGVTPAKLEVDRRDAGLDAILPSGAVLERVATGFTFTEGPVWVSAAVGGAGGTAIGEGYLLFSDPNRNTIYRTTRDGEVSVYRSKSGYSGVDIGEYRQPGSNGLALDREGRLTICEHGNRRVTRLEPNGVLTVLAGGFEAKRLNSPNDLVYRSDGALFFTDPPFGLPKFGDDPRRESPHTGVYSLMNDQLKLVTAELSGPNGIALSPDQKRLYVGNWDEARKVVMAYDLAADGAAGNGRVFCDLTTAPGEDAIDGVKVDQMGNVYVSGPGGLWVFSAEGKHLGTLRGPEHPHNMAWGDEDGRTLYWAAQTSIYRLRLNVPGVVSRPGSASSDAGSATADSPRTAAVLQNP